MQEKSYEPTEKYGGSCGRNISDVSARNRKSAMRPIASNVTEFLNDVPLHVPTATNLRADIHV
jgi:hypothetical protein